MLQNLLLRSKWRPAVTAGSPLILIATDPCSFRAIRIGLWLTWIDSIDPNTTFYKQYYNE